MLCLATGSQGEPFAAMSRIAINDHRFVKVGPDDTVVFSARAIPGNEKPIGHVMNHLARRGADVIYEGIKHVHVSGHGSEEELKLMLSLVRPRHFIPIHGEYRQLSQHARIAERVTAGIDARREGDAHRERRHPALRRERRARHRKSAGGARADRRLRLGRGRRRGAARSASSRRRTACIVPVVAINKQTGEMEGDPDVVSRGLAQDAASAELLRDGAKLVGDVIQGASIEERTDQGLIKEKIRVELRRFFRKRSGRRPLIVPVIMEV